MKAACIQLCAGQDRTENVTNVSHLIRAAVDAGATLVATPEMTNVIDRKPRRLFENLPEEAGLSEIETFSALAKELNIYLLIGSMAVALNKTAGQRKAANRAWFFGPKGQILATYDKLHMFDVNLPNGESWKESSLYQPGKEAFCVATALGVVGLSICYDLRFPGLYRALAQAGAQILAVPAAFTHQTGKAHWQPLLQARAIETGSFVVAPAQGGQHQDGRHTWGHSMIINPWGEIIAEKPDQTPGFIVADIDIRQVDQARQSIPNLALEQDFKIATL